MRANCELESKVLGKNVNGKCVVCKLRMEMKFFKRVGLIRPTELSVLLVPLEELTLSSSEHVANLATTNILPRLGEGCYLSGQCTGRAAIGPSDTRGHRTQVVFPPEYLI